MWCGTDASTRRVGKHPATGVVAAVMTSPLIAVTGSTGHVGGHVAARLAAAGARQRLVVRDPDRAPRLDGSEVAVATYDDVDAMTAAFAGADTVFLVSAAEHPERVQQHYNAVDAAATAGVRRVVYTSFVGAAPDSVFLLGRHHWLTEQRVRESGVGVDLPARPVLPRLRAVPRR